jgi:hypothetical protein
MKPTLSFTADFGYNALYQPNIQQTPTGIYPLLQPYVTFIRKRVSLEPRKRRG